MLSCALSENYQGRTVNTYVKKQLYYWESVGLTSVFDEDFTAADAYALFESLPDSDAQRELLEHVVQDGVSAITPADCCSYMLATISGDDDVRALVVSNARGRKFKTDMGAITHGVCTSILTLTPISPPNRIPKMTSPL